MDESQIRAWIGEIVIAGFSGQEPNHHVTRLIRHHRVRNIILFSRNVTSMAQVQRLNRQLQDMAQYPLIICTDQENGIVRRVAPDLPGLPGNMAVAATGNPGNAQRIGTATAEQLLTLGINMNLAPDIDVNNNPKNPVIGVRSYGEDPDSVAEFGAQMVSSMQACGVIACGKHFPGHGDTSADSHLALPKVAHTLARLESVELVPFHRAIQAGVDAIMTAHITFPSIEPGDIPATLSRRVLTGFLRERLGFEGVVTTDCLEMNAISQTIGVGEGAVQAVLAGADMVMVSHRLDRQEQAIDALVYAVGDGRLSADRLQNAAERVHRLRQRRTVQSRHDTIPLPELVQRAAQVQADVSSQSVTIVANDTGLLPIDPSGFASITVLADATVPRMEAADEVDGRADLFHAVQLRCPECDVQYQLVSSDDAPTAIIGSGRTLFIVGLNGTTNRNYLHLVQDLVHSHCAVVVVALQSPYDLEALTGVNTSIALYENTPWMAEAGANALFGVPAPGRLPVTLNIRSGQ